MGNSRKRCAECKKYFSPETGIQRGAQFFCSKDHLIDYATKNSKKLAQQGRKIERKEAKNRLDDLNRKSIKWQHKQTQPVFNKMRVLEEMIWFKSRGLEPTCISCGKPLGNDQWCCGHFKTVGAQGRLRYDERNTYLQHNRHCNMGLSGDIAGTKNTHGYIEGLKLRFGEEEGRSIIDYCEANTAPYKWTWHELEDLRAKCNARIRELKLKLKEFDFENLSRLNE